MPNYDVNESIIVTEYCEVCQLRTQQELTFHRWGEKYECQSCEDIHSVDVEEDQIQVLESTCIHHL